MLETENEKKNIFRVAKQLIRRSRDIVGGACVKDGNGKVIAEDNKVKEVWREYFDKLLNAEFPWSRDMLEPVSLK